MRNLPRYLTFSLLVGAIGLILLVVRAGAAHAGQAPTTQYSSLFAFKACQEEDPFFCPDGQFNEQAFAQMYLNPELAEPHYPSEDVGPYKRYVVPTCEDENCAGDMIRCTDGTRPLFYYNPGSGADADKWIIKIQGGGGTCGAGNCALGYLTKDRDDFSSAYGRNKAGKRAQGILSNRQDNLFRNYNLVTLDKCVGDRNLGDATITDYTYAPNASGPVYFHGFRIVKAVLQALATQQSPAPDITNASTIAFMTQSNGSNGAYLYIDRLHQYVLNEIAAPGHSPDVRFLASSFLFPSPEIEYALASDAAAAEMPGISMPPSYRDTLGHVDGQTTATTICGRGFEPSDPSYQDWLDQGEQVDGPAKCQHGEGKDHERGIGGMFFSTADYRFGREAGYLETWGASDETPTIDASCYEAHMPTGDVEACHDATHVLIYHLTTPTFFGAQMADRNLRSARLSSWTTTFDPAHCDPGDPDCHGENFRDNDGQPSEGGWEKEDYRRRVLAILEARFHGQSAHQEEPQGPGHGAFVDNTVEHSSFARMIKLRRTMIPSAGADPLELQEYLWRWLDPANEQPVVCVDEGEIYDVEFAPPTLLADAPPGLACDAGAYYDPDIPIDPEQRCNDPYDNVASASFACLAPANYANYLPLLSRN